jgi:hypothetical protein
MRWTQHVAHTREMRNACIILVEKLEGKSRLKDLGVDDRSALKWILDIRCDDLDWIRLAQDR